MNMEERSRALLALVDEYRDSKSREIVDAARAEARMRVVRALDLARTRVHEAIVDERRRHDVAVAGAQARLHTRQRLAHQGRETVILAECWRLLPAVLTERWRDRAGRNRWAQAHLGRALAALPRVRWEISHAAGWADDERRTLTGWVAARGGPELVFETDATLAAGFRVRAGHNTLDATLEGLLADRRAIEGRLLHYLEVGTGGAA